MRVYPLIFVATKLTGIEDDGFIILLPLHWQAKLSTTNSNIHYLQLR
jgi:hypothetical protein